MVFRCVIALTLACLLLPAQVCAQADAILRPGLGLFDARKYPEALAAFRKLSEQHPEDAAVWYHLGRSHYHLRQIAEAVASLENAIALDGSKADHHYLLGLAYSAYFNEVGLVRKIGVARKMKLAWDTAIRLDPGHRDSLVALVDYYVQAPGLAGGSMGKAEGTMAQLRHHYPDRVFYSEGLIAEEKGQSDRAYQIFRHAAETNRTPRSVFSLARFLYRNKKYDEAIRSLHEYLTLELSWMDPIKGFAYLLLGTIYAEKEMNTQARRAFELARAENRDKFIGETIQKRMRELN